MTFKNPNRVFPMLSLIIWFEMSAAGFSDCVAADICFCAVVRSELWEPPTSWYWWSAAFFYWKRGLNSSYSCCLVPVWLWGLICIKACKWCSATKTFTDTGTKTYLLKNKQYIPCRPVGKKGHLICWAVFRFCNCFDPISDQYLQWENISDINVLQQKSHASVNLHAPKMHASFCLYPTFELKGGHISHIFN